MSYGCDIGPFYGRLGRLRIAALSVVKGRNRTGCITLEVAQCTKEMLQFGTATEKSEEEGREGILLILINGYQRLVFQDQILSIGCVKPPR